jgi:hypothetical protein
MLQALALWQRRFRTLVSASNRVSLLLPLRPHRCSSPPGDKPLPGLDLDRVDHVLQIVNRLSARRGRHHCHDAPGLEPGEDLGSGWHRSPLMFRELPPWHGRGR